MAKATRVLSTPRKPASKIKTKPTESNKQRALSHGEAFCDLEGPIGEIYCMSKITADVSMNITRSPENEIVAFAVSQLCEMVRDLHAKYRKNLYAGKAVA
jgi:hypothetical protein